VQYAQCSECVYPSPAPIASRHPINRSFLKPWLGTSYSTLPRHYPQHSCSHCLMIPGLPVCSLIVQTLNSPVQSECLEFPPGLRGSLFVCWGQNVVSHSLMGLQGCLGLIIPKVILKVTQPQTLCLQVQKGDKKHI
jgi:hypothetical protein